MRSLDSMFTSPSISQRALPYAKNFHVGSTSLKNRTTDGGVKRLNLNLPFGKRRNLRRIKPAQGAIMERPKTKLAPPETL